MTSHIRNITFDCVAWEPLVEFWSEAVDYAEDPGQPERCPATRKAICGPRRADPACCSSRFPRARRSRTGCTSTSCRPSSTRDEEVERLVSLGAVMYDDHRRDDGSGFVVLQDPEGNELCVERSEPSGEPAPA